MDNAAALPETWSATALDLDFARAHRALEDDGVIVIMKAGDGETLQWRRFVATFDHMTLLNVLGPRDQGVHITTVGVVLHMPATMLHALGIRRSAGHADSLTADYGLLFALSDREYTYTYVYVYVCIHTHACMYIHVYIYTSLRLYFYTSIHIWICTYTHSKVVR